MCINVIVDKGAYTEICETIGELADAIDGDVIQSGTGHIFDGGDSDQCLCSVDYQATAEKASFQCRIATDEECMITGDMFFHR